MTTAPLPFDVRLIEAQSMAPNRSGVIVHPTDRDDGGLDLIECPVRRIRLLPPARPRDSSFDWYDFSHRCRLEFARHLSTCEWLAETARSSTLWLTYSRRKSIQHGARELKRHLELLEAHRRYDRGWMIGGYTLPVRAEIERLGGLWLGKHKTWTMPDRASWLHVLSLLPGDF